MLFLLCLKEVVDRCHQILLASLCKSPRPKQRSVTGTELSLGSLGFFPSRESCFTAYFPVCLEAAYLQLTEGEEQSGCSCYLPSHLLHKELEEGIATSASCHSHPSSAVVFTIPNCCTVSSATSFTLLVTTVLAILIF